MADVEELVERIADAYSADLHELLYELGNDLIIEIAEKLGLDYDDTTNEDMGD